MSLGSEVQRPQGVTAPVPEKISVGGRTAICGEIATFVLITALAGVILLGMVLHKTGGIFGFSLDDPYIDLALAEHILDGHYGLNLNEAASPSSSIVFPFLVAALLKLGMGQMAVLAVNLIATAAGMALLVVLAVDAGLDLARAGVVRLIIVAVAVLLGLNLVGLAYTGLEHSIHVTDTLACLLGINRTVRTRRMPRWLPLVLVLNPLIRFEGLSIWGTGIIVLWLESKRAGAFVTALAGLVFVGGFCWYLRLLGLPLLPSSVLAKSLAAQSTGVGGTLVEIVRTLALNLKQYGASQLVLAWALVLARARDQGSGRIVLFVSLPIIAHLVAGAFGWFGRYEIYILTFAWTGVLMLYGSAIARWLTGAWPGFAAGVLLWLGMHANYAFTTLFTPRAVTEVHLQQFQMHRFAVEFWRAPVAVNDLGWVAYQNRNYVLDLFGLGSEVAREHRMERDTNPFWMEQLVEYHHVGVAMIYPSWFPAIPANWTAVATLTLDRTPVAVASSQVTIYATNPEIIPVLCDALRRFQPTLPHGVKLSLQ